MISTRSMCRHCSCSECSFQQLCLENPEAVLQSYPCLRPHPPESCHELVCHQPKTCLPPAGNLFAISQGLFATADFTWYNYNFPVCRQTETCLPPAKNLFAARQQTCLPPVKNLLATSQQTCLPPARNLFATSQ